MIGSGYCLGAQLFGETDYPIKKTDFPFFCLPNWAIHSIDRNQQNSGSKTNYFRFLKAGLIFNRLIIRFLFPKWSAPNGPATRRLGF